MRKIIVAVIIAGLLLLIMPMAIASSTFPSVTQTITQKIVAPTLWNCPIGDETLIAPYPSAGRPFLTQAVACNEITVSAGAKLWAIFRLDETTAEADWTELSPWPWLYYSPLDPASNLTQLEPGKYYYVIVSAPCTLTIPQGKVPSTDWWSLSLEDRKLKATELINQYSVPIRASHFIRSATKPTHNPFQEWLPGQIFARCWAETALRYYQFADNSIAPSDVWWYDQLADQWKPVKPETCLKLPCVQANISKGSFGHTVCALQVGTDRTRFDSWIFFNLDEVVTPGNPAQMPYGATVALFNVIGAENGGQLKLSRDPFAMFGWR